MTQIRLGQKSYDIGIDDAKFPVFMTNTVQKLWGFLQQIDEPAVTKPNARAEGITTVPCGDSILASVTNDPLHNAKQQLLDAASFGSLFLPSIHARFPTITARASALAKRDDFRNFIQGADNNAWWAEVRAGRPGVTAPTVGTTLYDRWAQYTHPPTWAQPISSAGLRITISEDDLDFGVPAEIADEEDEPRENESRIFERAVVDNRAYEAERDEESPDIVFVYRGSGSDVTAAVARERYPQLGTTPTERISIANREYACNGIHGTAFLNGERVYFVRRNYTLNVREIFDSQGRGLGIVLNSNWPGGEFNEAARAALAAIGART